MCPNSTRSAEDVMQLLELTKSGKPYSTIDNAAIIFREDPLFRGNLRANLLRDRIELTGEMPWPRAKTDVGDMDDIHIRHYIEKNYQFMNDKKIREGMQVIASENGYHPVRDYLNALEWDGTERIRYVLHHFLGAGTDEHIYEFMKLFLLGRSAGFSIPGASLTTCYAL